MVNEEQTKIVFLLTELIILLMSIIVSAEVENQLKCFFFLPFTKTTKWLNEC